MSHHWCNPAPYIVNQIMKFLMEIIENWHLKKYIVVRMYAYVHYQWNIRSKTIINFEQHINRNAQSILYTWTVESTQLLTATYSKTVVKPLGRIFPIKPTGCINKDCTGVYICEDVSGDTTQPSLSAAKPNSNTLKYKWNLPAKRDQVEHGKKCRVNYTWSVIACRSRCFSWCLKVQNVGASISIRRFKFLVPIRWNLSCLLCFGVKTFSY